MDHKDGMDETDLLRRLGLALAIGLLFGLERGWSARRRPEGGRIAGLRTFALAGLLGGICGWLATITTPVVLGFAFLGVAMLVSVSYAIRLQQDDDRGLTTEIALLVAFGLGAGAVLGDMPTTAAAAVLAAALLALKTTLHRWVKHLRRFELMAVLQLAVISVVVLPVLPDRGFGPGGVLNPHAIWWAVILVAGLSFAGYAAMRLAGDRLGAIITGLFGGLASSTPTTLALARRARAQPPLAPVLSVGIVLAGAVTFLRITILAALFAPALLDRLAVPMACMALAGLGGAGLIFASLSPEAQKDRATPPPISNPLGLEAALLFGLLLAAVLLGTHYLRQWFGDAGVYTAAALSGITDVDAITISLARIAETGIAVRTAAIGIFVATGVNTLIKAAITLAVAGWPAGWRVMAAHGASLATGAAVIAAIG
ncbi:MAG: MgtC/SapB family protein [Roseovarius sp.]|nr:MgtC/SapB family protein [Roseovarius sp.]